MKLEVLYGCPNLGIISAPWGYRKETPDVIQMFISCKVRGKMGEKKMRYILRHVRSIEHKIMTIKEGLFFVIVVILAGTEFR